MYADIHTIRREKIQPGANGLGVNGSDSRWTGSKHFILHFHKYNESSSIYSAVILFMKKTRPREIQYLFTVLRNLSSIHKWKTEISLNRLDSLFDRNTSLGIQMISVSFLALSLYRLDLELTLLSRLQEIVGVFMKNCLIHYATYRNTFPLFALGEYRKAVFATPQRL